MIHRRGPRRGQPAECSTRTGRSRRRRRRCTGPRRGPLPPAAIGRRTARARPALGRTFRRIRLALQGFRSSGPALRRPGRWSVPTAAARRRAGPDSRRTPQIEIPKAAAPFGVLDDDHPPRLRVATTGREPGGVEHPGQHGVVDGLVGEFADRPGGAQRLAERQRCGPRSGPWKVGRLGPSSKA